MQLCGGQRRREDCHNDTDVQREREREAKTAEQEDPEKVGVNPTEKVRRSGRQWHSCQRSGLRSQASPVHFPSTGAKGFLCAGVPLLKKLRAATRDENPRAQSRLGHGVVDAGRPQGLPKTVGQTLQHQATVCADTNVGGAIGSPILRRIVVAISGCRSRTMERQSATCPECRSTRSNSVTETHPAKRERHRGNVPNRWICVESNTQNVPQATPQSIRMAFSERLNCLRSDHPQHVVRPSTCTMQEKGPRRLQILCPRWTWMRAWDHNSSATAECASMTLSGSGVAMWMSSSAITCSLSLNLA